ncbi:hypothetical protein ASPZODRAFT_134689 [Penicilliopsis zonata CBS 506.65]|uniref:Uncharacterized protein n=1 Tax=Penicilliopsis zonata CBS 506.65 TaxID=1073090 RepID=A0A1L9SBS1_9EURO|nr:hypothetical protein ASPZODRAFT_134689 [Penicilliopsis zonata CBS 506.65]OJJ44603.1 hypothetical protein ASPZODRAFT_134689 [Penicilliopsis zonata CBS 506.65]
MSLFARVSSYPPLEQVTVVRRQRACKSDDDDKLRFTVVLESSSTFPQQEWEVQIWHNLTTSSSTEWTALPLKPRDAALVPLLSTSDPEYKYWRHVFAEEITLPRSAGSAQFTVRYRTGSDEKWQWANQQRAVKDGELVFGPRQPHFEEAVLSSSSSRQDLAKYIDELSYDVEIESRKSEAPGSLLWELSGAVDGAKEDESSIKKISLGVPSSVHRYFALVRLWTPWLAPRHGKKKFKLSEDAILCSFLRTDGVHVVLLAVSGTDDVLTLFQSGERGDIVVHAKNDGTEGSRFQVLVSVAEDFEVALGAVIYEARKLVRPYDTEEETPLQIQVEEEPTIPDSPTSDDVVIVEKEDPRAQWMTEWFDGLTYCTWNALGQQLTEEKILNALEVLNSHGIKIVNLIIDDNWQSLDRDVDDSQFKRGWMRFEANADAFPRGLKQLVQSIRQVQPSIEHVAVWHALMGYWGGISPDGELATNYKTKQVRVKDPVAGGEILAIDPDDVSRFYDDFYSYLSSVGIDSVKTDAQFFLDLLEDPEDRRRFTKAYQDAWTVATLTHFSTRSISCMSLFPQAIFHSQLPMNRPSILLRNSDDFFPNIPASHPWHVFCNAHNALLTRHLNVVPDWDMFQTSHAYAAFHAAARCVSGGPIYITDEPGNHDLDVIHQMTAQTVHGKAVTLRPSIAGRTLDVYHGYNEGNLLRIGTYTGWARTGSGIMGLFNINSAETGCMIPLIDFPGIHERTTSTDQRQSYIVRAHTSGRITHRMQPLAPDSLIAVSLGTGAWEILTAYPTRSFTLKGSRGCGDGSNTTETETETETSKGSSTLTHVAILGLLDKMTGAAALVSSDIFLVENGRLRFDISLKAMGRLGIYFSDLQDRSIAKQFMVMISGQPVPRKTVSKDGQVLAVDVLGAWNALGLDPGWSNEVFVQVFVG